jgi:hypothetical protein
MAPVRRLRNLLTPHQQNRSHEECPGGVAEPPGDPDRPEIGPSGKATEAQARNADRRTDRGARERGQAGELENVARPLEGATAVRETFDERRRRLPRCYPGRSRRRRDGTRSQVGERRRESGRPGARRRRSAARAMPVGGQTGVALRCRKASESVWPRRHRLRRETRPRPAERQAGAAI